MKEYQGACIQEEEDRNIAYGIQFWCFLRAMYEMFAGEDNKLWYTAMFLKFFFCGGTPKIIVHLRGTPAYQNKKKIIKRQLLVHCGLVFLV
jgi:hypothetical protein